MKSILYAIFICILSISNCYSKEPKIKKNEISLNADQLEFLNDQKILKKKLDFCMVSIEKSNGGSTGPCNDAVEFHEYLSKGDGKAYLEYNLQAGNLNNGNMSIYLENLKKLRTAIGYSR